MTDKTIMEQNWNNIYNDLKNAEEKLRTAQNILKTSFVLNNKPYYVNELKNMENWFYDIRSDINNRVIPAIKNL